MSRDGTASSARKVSFASDKYPPNTQKKLAAITAIITPNANDLAEKRRKQ